MDEVKIPLNNILSRFSSNNNQRLQGIILMCLCANHDLILLMIHLFSWIMGKF